MSIKKENLLKICNEISETCACEGKRGYCFFKELALYKFSDARIIAQLECIEKFKYEESERQKKDIGISKAATLWAEIGLAKAFSLAYDDALSIKDLYKKTIEIHTQLFLNQNQISLS